MTYYSIDAHFIVQGDGDYSALLKADQYLKNNGLLGVLAQVNNQPPTLRAKLYITAITDDEGKPL